MDNQFDSATPEQKLHSLTAMLRTSVEIIRGSAQLIRLQNEITRIEPQKILEDVSRISEAVDKMMKLLDEVVRSEGFYQPTKDLSSTDILLSLRQQLLEASEAKDVNTLKDLAITFRSVGLVASSKGYNGQIQTILDNLELSAMEYAVGITWKAIIPSEEEIISSLNRS